MVALAAAIAHAARLWLWQPWRTVRTPLVWVLHGAYAWIVIHLALRALAAAGVVGESLAWHALTLGAIGGLTIGMMTRTAKGHTGRPLVADGFEVAAYGLVMAAAAGPRGRRRAPARGLRRDGRRLGRALVAGLRDLRRALLAGAHPSAARRQAGMR